MVRSYQKARIKVCRQKDTEIWKWREEGDVAGQRKGVRTALEKT